MADLYPPSYPPRQQQPQPYHPRDSQSYQLNQQPNLSYPAIMSSQQNHQQPQQPQQQPQPASGSLSPDDEHPQKQSDQSTTPKPDQSGHAKPQATFLTKLYALLERPENHHMIRWDPAGEYIIVEKPEQLALHVLPSVYRQSRFASFSRQLNIYGFMRKVNLRNVDPAIDDPDASTWSHPTLTRHSPPEVVANFKRRVPPRLPKPKRRETDPAPGPAYPAQRGNPSMGPVPLPTSSVPQRPPPMNGNPRPRGLSTPGSYSPLNQNGAPTAGWGSTDVFPSVSGPGNMRGTALRPLTVPSDPPMNSHLYSHPSHIQGISPADETPPSTAGGYGSMPPYPSHGQNRGMMAEPQHQFAYAMPDQHPASSAWTSNPTSSHSASLSSLLNPPSQNGSPYPRGAPGPAQMSYPSPFAHGPGQHSPDSRPNTGYSVISAYDDAASPTSHAGFDYSRPNSSHHRGVSPGSSRPGSSHRVGPASYGQPGSLSIRRVRRHSQAMSPYPSPYGDDDRPLTANHPDDRTREIGLPRSRSMISINQHPEYSYNPTHAAGDFAYTAGEGDVWPKGTRPGTSASSLSTTTTGSPETGTPPVTRGGHPGDYTEADVSRFTPDFGFVSMADHLPHYSKELE